MTKHFAIAKSTASDHSANAVEVKQALERLASPEKAKASAWFFKTGKEQYGEGDRFIGVTVPEQRKVAKQFKELPLPELEKLLESSIHEHRLTALFILVGQYQRAGKSRELRGESREQAQQRIVDCYLRNLDRVNNWDLVDSSAPQILGAWLLARGTVAPSSRVKREIPIEKRDFSQAARNDQTAELPISLLDLAKSEHLWHRRIAIITCQAFIRAGEFAAALQIAELLVHDSHDLIQKAVGWMLREIGDRDQVAERVFLDRHVATMPRTMLRYAIEKFPAEERARYLRRDR